MSWAPSMVRHDFLGRREILKNRLPAKQAAKSITHQIIKRQVFFYLFFMLCF